MRILAAQIQQTAFVRPLGRYFQVDVEIGDDLREKFSGFLTGFIHMERRLPHPATPGLSGVKLLNVSLAGNGVCAAV